MNTVTDVSNRKILEVKNLKKHYPIKAGFLRKIVGHVKAVDGISFDLYEGETLGLVGESGCGKSTAARTILRLSETTEGEIIFNNQNITHVKGENLRQIRKDFQMVFQDPYASLNPTMMVGDIVAEPIKNYRSDYTSKSLQKEIMQLLEKVGLPQDAYYKFPHEFSGGQRQRIGIARALALNPKLIVADEPVSALDVSIQSQVLNLLKSLQKEYRLTYLFIAHDLSVVKHMSDKIGVMYLGHIVEFSDKKSIYNEPLHPYTQALISAVPKPRPGNRSERIVLQGDVPSPANPPSGCTFHPRCSQAMDECQHEKPVFKEVRPGHQVACHLFNS